MSATAIALAHESTAARRQPPPSWLVLTAFAAVYIVWGSTYLGIRIAIGSIPPFLMAGARFTLAGAILYGILRFRGAVRPAPYHWVSAFIIGSLLLVAGNGGVSWAEQTVPSGLTALIIAATPLWINLLDWLRPNGKRPNALVALGLAAGFTGVALIVAIRAPTGSRMVDPRGASVLLFATLCWALGSIYSRHARLPANHLLAIAMQMLAGGALQILTGVILGETRGFDLRQVTPASAWAFTYLTLAGSLLGFTAYAWLLQVSTPARVSTYAYVNPFIAVLLGHFVLGEEVSKGIIAAGGIILAAVVLITRKPHR